MSNVAEPEPPPWLQSQEGVAMKLVADAESARESVTSGSITVPAAGWRIRTAGTGLLSVRLAVPETPEAVAVTVKVPLLFDDGVKSPLEEMTPPPLTLQVKTGALVVRIPEGPEAWAVNCWVWRLEIAAMEGVTVTFVKIPAGWEGSDPFQVANPKFAARSTTGVATLLVVTPFVQTRPLV